MDTLTPKTARGFTLIEVLVAMAIFAILSVLAYGGLTTILDSRTHNEQFATRLAQLQLAIATIGYDIEQITERGIRDEYGETITPIRSGQLSNFKIEFSKAGWRNPAMQSRSTLQRVAYVLNGETLERHYWPVLDRAQDSESKTKPLLESVDEFDIIFIDEQLNQHSSWPIEEDLTGKEQPHLPRAITIKLVLSDWGNIERTFYLISGTAKL